MINDDFSYSDGPLSDNSGWEETAYQGSLIVDEGLLAGVAFETRCNLRAGTWGAEQGSEITLATIGSSAFPGAIIHGVFGSNKLVAGYLLTLQASGNWELYQYDAESDEVIASGFSGSSAANGDTIRIESVGDDLLVYRNETLLQTIENETTYRAGKPGILLYRESSEYFLDDWVGTGESAGAVEAEGAGAAATASAPAASAEEISVKLTGFRLISKVGAPVADLSGLTALIYKSVPSTLAAPDKRVGSLSTDGSGVLADIDISDIQSNNNPVWLTMMLDGSPAKGTTVKLIPTVS